MKKNLFASLIYFLIPAFVYAQNTGIGTTAPKGRLHIKGNADSSQLVIDGGSNQTNTHPLIRLRNAAGADLVHIHSDNPNNTFVGLNAGRVNDAAGGALGNTFIGALAGSLNITGYSLTGIGRGALFNNTSGGENTAIGPGTLYYNTTGFNNTAIGRGALYQTNASDNTATGFKALFSNTTGKFNTANGSQALVSSIYGSSNTANGYQALYSNTASDNTANGYQALYFNTTGSDNNAVGYQALYHNTAGEENTAAGTAALLDNTTGSNNTAAGALSLGQNINGSYNTAVGGLALFSNLGGSGNTAVGYFAGVVEGNLYNATAIGYNAVVNASNKVRIGSAAVTVIEGQVAYSFPSDGRFKYNIKYNVPGLDFIEKLRPVTYYFDEEKFDEYSKTGILSNKSATAVLYQQKRPLHTGFIAQDVERIANESGYDFDGVHSPANDRDHYSLAYSQFIMPLVTAVQEQQKMIDQLKDQVAELIKHVALLKDKH